MELRHTHPASERDSDSFASAEQEVASSDVHDDEDETSQLHACTGEGVAASEEGLPSDKIEEVDDGSTTRAGCDKTREDHIATLMK